ncbi:MAG: hypothetical protein J1F32_05555 [Erysipelotrichales bacterium]|nr:hypothetical protein [Erysipelotrichales bacterium]
MKKSNLKKAIWILPILLTGCTYDIPEGDIKDFVDRLNFDLAYQHVNTGKSVITATYYINGEVDGKVCSTTYFDKTDDTKYYYINTEVDGSFIGDGEDQYTYSNEQILTYLDTDESVKAFKKTDGNLDKITYRLEDLNISINNFFYTELESGYHRGGVYYGDYIVANCGRYYSCFSLNEDKTCLRYAVNTKSVNSEGDSIYTMHDFTVDEFGMIINLSSKSLYYEKNITIETTIACEYNMEVEKITEL